MSSLKRDSIQNKPSVLKPDGFQHLENFINGCKLLALYIFLDPKTEENFPGLQTVRLVSKRVLLRLNIDPLEYRETRDIETEERQRDGNNIEGL